MPTKLENQMLDIPNVEFSNLKLSQGIEFEALALNALFSRHSQMRHVLEEPHRLEFYAIMCISKGSGVHFIDFKPHAYEKGSLLFVSKGQVHAFAHHQDVDGILILFTEEFVAKHLTHSGVRTLYRLYNYYLYSPAIQLGGNEKGLIHAVVQAIYDEYQEMQTPSKEEILRHLLKALLLKVEQVQQGQYAPDRSVKRVALFGRFSDFLEQHYAETRGAQDYAAMLNISYKHLNETCKAVTGESAKKCIDRHIVLEAQRTLATSDVSIKQLTCQLGFDEPTNLVKFFKKHTGQSPSQFQKMLKK